MSDEKSKKGLGRGLMSLFGDQEEVSTSGDSKNAYSSISIGDLVPNKFQPRNYFDDAKIEELAKSIKKNGLIQPVLVRVDKDEAEGKTYEIIAGERRWLAAQRAGLHDIPVIISNINDKQSLELAIIENIQREELNSMDEAKGYERLMKEFNYSHEKLSEFMGKSRSHISNTLRLLSLPAEVIKLVDEGKLTAGQVRPLVGRHNALNLALSILKEKLSARSIENLVRIEKEKEGKNKKKKEPTNAHALLAERKIEEKLGLSVKVISKKNNSGKIVLEYNNIDQSEMLHDLLTGKQKKPH
jgi:ParB family chromosome partitioning protein